MNINTSEYWNKVWKESPVRNYKNVYNIITNWINPKSIVLDIGCGTGILLEKIRKERECEVTGLEHNNECINQLQEKQIKAIKATLPDIPIKDKFDYVIATEVLEHLDDDLLTLKNMIEIGKTIIVSIPDNCLSPKQEKEHIRIYRYETLYKLLKQVAKNVQIIKTSDFGYPRLVARASNIESFVQDKVYISILNQGSINTELCKRLFPYITSYKKKIYLEFSSDKPISNNRNKIVQRFLASDCNYLLMIDEDTVPLKNPLDLVEFDKDVIGCVYPQWKGTDMMFMVVDKIGEEYKQVLVDRRNGLKKVDAIGTGCILIARRVLEKIKKPFERKFDDDGIAIKGLDFYFCDKAKEVGFEVYAHWDYICDHYKPLSLLTMIELVNKYNRKEKNG